MATLMTVIEELIDREGLGRVLEEIASICAEKAEHIRSNWQDPRLAKHWAKAGDAVAKVQQNLPACLDETAPLRPVLLTAQPLYDLWDHYGEERS